MLHLTMYFDKSQNPSGFSLQGHASDSLVCAGVSAIAQAAVVGILHYEHGVDHCGREGLTAIRMRTPTERGVAILETAINGILATAAYGHNQLEVHYRADSDWPFSDKV